MKPFTIHGEAEARRLEKGSGTVVRSTLRAVPETVPDPFSSQELEAALNRNRRMPHAFAAIDDQGTRKHRLHRFPYTLYYVDLGDSVWIVAVAHQKRRPGYWSGRKPQAGADG